LVDEIDAVFKSAGTSTSGFLDHIANFETCLTTIGADKGSAHKLAMWLETIGKQVRGPDDTPVKVPRRFR
jgi:hypothetical protein